MRFAVTIMLMSLAAPAVARDIVLGLPIACDLGETCYIQQFVDHDPSDAASDFACGSLTYDGHKGTDFALLSRAMIAAGVDVIAAAPGTVRGVRDEMPDILQGQTGAPDTNRRECGNGMVISHGNGWETQYCHLKRGTITVQSGDRVAMGDILGQVGMSGQTEFPHLHLSLRHRGEVVDPFDPDGAITCGVIADTLWATPVATQAGGLISAGFAPDVPDYDEIKAGNAAAESLAPNNNLVLWGYAFGGQTGDVMITTITRPDGTKIETRADPLDRPIAQYFRTGGRHAPSTGWPVGTYTGAVTIERNGASFDVMTTMITFR